MSYLDTPRLHFSGKFFTNPSTINNATENYDLEEQYNNNPPTDTNPNSVWWNQNGQAFFKILNSTTITAAKDQSGRELASREDDVLIGGILESVIEGTPNAQFARMVDLDPDQQARSMIVGLKLKLSIPSEPTVYMTGSVRPMCIRELWGRVQGGSGGGIASAGCMYQSVIENLEWYIDDAKSILLRQLQTVSASTGKLSFKMVVDAYNGDVTDASAFGQGRVVGTIGPYYTGEPAHFLAARCLFNSSEAVQKDYPRQPSPLNTAPFKVQDGTLIIDLGNSIPTTAPLAGPFKNVGQVAAVIDPLGQNLVIEPPLFTSVNEYEQQYYNKAGIFERPLGQHAALLQSKILGLRILTEEEVLGSVTGTSAGLLKEGLTIEQAGGVPAAAPVGVSVALAERNDGIYVDVDHNTLRLEKGAPPWSDTAQSGTEITSDAVIEFTATQFGKPAANIDIQLSTAQNQYQFRNKDGEFYNINNKPADAMVMDAQPAPTDSEGKTSVKFTGGDLAPQDKPERRRILDGQLYLYQHNYFMGGVQPITLLLFENSPVIENPTWWEHIHPVFLQFARLYPFMRSLIDLSDYATVTNPANIKKIQMVLTLPRTHPGYMPVTRDFSVRHTNMFLQWIKNGMPEGVKPS